MMAALDEFRRNDTHAVRARTHVAIHEYIECLHPLVGTRLRSGMRRVGARSKTRPPAPQRRKIAEADRPALDALSAALIKELDRELVNVGLAFVNEQLILKRALDNAWERDE